VRVSRGGGDHKGACRPIPSSKLERRLHHASAPLTDRTQCLLAGGTRLRLATQRDLSALRITAMSINSCRTAPCTGER
jgi:hypothetical protein